MSSTNPFQAEAVQNYAQKCCVALVLDTSSSMDASSAMGRRIDQLNAGIQAFFDEIKADNANLGQKLEVGIVSFNSGVERVCEPKLVEFIDFQGLQTSGTTRMVDGVREGINMVRQRKTWYKQTGQNYYRPWVIMITDGEPDDDQKHQLAALAAEIQQGMQNKEFCFMAIGVEGADANVLQSISNSEIPPRMIAGLRFADFFRWLSATIADVAKGQDVSTAVKNSGQTWDGGFNV
jgi:uncharacterized protein YegL